MTIDMERASGLYDGLFGRVRKRGKRWSLKRRQRARRGVLDLFIFPSQFIRLVVSRNEETTRGHDEEWFIAVPINTL
jgi:hypothetical protein